MSREERFARQVCQLLDKSVGDLDPAIAERLRAARWRAIERQSLAEPVGEVSIVGAGGTAFRHGGSRSLRILVGMCALLIGMGSVYYWNGFDQAQVNEEIDIALLSDDLPPKAYLDPGFQAWISHYAQSAR